MKRTFRTRLLASTLLVGAVAISAPAMAQDTPADASATATPTPSQPEIVVTGSRITNPNLTSISPVTVVNAAEVKQQGNVRVEDLLNSLPQVFANEGSSDSNGASGIATVDLRDLGPARTLVLINGRRLGPGDPTDVVADLNFIPGALIQRVDVLTGGASATYGSDALAGVVNFVLNQNFDGVQFDAQTSFYNHNNRYSETNMDASLAAHGFVPPKGMTTDGAVQNLNVTMGAGFDDGRGHITAYAGYRKVNPVTQGARDFSYCGYSAGTTSGSPYYTCGGSSTSAVGRFRRTTNVGLGANPVYSPTGTSFTTDPANTGTFRTYNGARDGYNFNPTNYFQRPDTRYTFGAFAHYDISDSFKPYMELMFMDDHTRAQIAASGAFYGTDFFVNCNNPFLSATQQGQLCGAAAGTNTLQSLYIGRRNVEGGPRVDDLRHTDYRIVLGMKGDINDAISYDVSGSMYRAILVERYENDFSRVKINRSLNVVNGPGGTPVCAAAIPNAQGQVIDPTCVPWNPFQPGGVTQAAVNYLQTPGLRQGESNEYIAQGTVSVDFGKYGLQLPWTDNGVQAAFGVEYRKETTELLNDNEFLTGDLAGQGTPFGVRDVHGQYDVKEVFSEISIPIVSDKPGFYALGLTGGYRYSDYSIQGATDTYKIQGEWAPIKQLRIRGGYNRAVRAPNTLELFSTPNVTLFAGRDPCAGATPSRTLAQCARSGVTAAEYGFIDANPAAQYNQRVSGNINLIPETADTFTAGFVVNPVHNLTITADAYSIEVKNLITTLGANFILTNCVNSNLFCANVQRAPGGSLFTGTGFVDNPTLNIGSEKTRGVDVTALYRMDIGSSTLSFDLVGSYLDKFTVDPGAAGTTPYECSGQFGLTCGTPLPKWRHKLRVSYDMKNGLGFSAAWRFFSSVNNDQLTINGLTPCPASGGNPNGCVNNAVTHIGNVSYFDLSMTARIADHYTFRLGAQNLLDKNPPVLDTNYTNNGSNTYAQVYDALGRYVYAAIQLNF